MGEKERPPWLVADDEADRARNAARLAEIAEKVETLGKLAAAISRAEKAEAEVERWKTNLADRAELSHLRAAISSVRALHVRVPDKVAPRLGLTAPDMCSADWATWPCPTIAALDSSGTVEDAPKNENGIELARITVGARVRLTGLKGEVDATIVRMDSPTFGVVEIEPDERALFSAHNVIAILPSAQLPEERSDEKADPGFGSVTVAAAELVQAATSGGRMSEDMHVELAPERSDEEPKYRWRVMFISRATLLDGEQDMGRHDFDDEAVARAAMAGWLDRVDEYWRIELRRQLVVDWETVEDTGYAAPPVSGLPVDGETT